MKAPIALQKFMPRRPWLFPAGAAVILFIGGVASNLVANDLQQLIGPYRRWVWVVFAIALVVAVVTASLEGRSEDPSSTAKKALVGNDSANPTVNALHQLRAPVGDFVGREEEIKTLINALRNTSRACITSISGMGGIGKTELALFVAQQLQDDYPDAQFFINLQGTDANPRAPEEVMAICIRALLGPEAILPEDFDDLSPLYRSQLRGKRTLLLLDNVADSAQVLSLFPPPGSALLVTSRQMVALPAMTSLTLNPLTDQEAQKLLLEIAPHAEGVAGEICALCGYLPLAIRAAGSLLAVTVDLDPNDYAAQLKDERQRLERIGTESVEIGVAASFNLSYERLAPEAARVFRLLSVLPASFDTAEEERVCADNGHTQLSEILRRSLVLYDSDTKRYRLHDLARLFAASKLTNQERAIVQKSGTLSTMSLPLPHRYDRYRLIAFILVYQKSLYPTLTQIKVAKITGLNQTTVSRLLSPTLLGERGRRNSKLNRNHLLALSRKGLKMDHRQASLLLWLAEGEDYKPWTADECADQQLEPTPGEALEANSFRSDSWHAYLAIVELLGKRFLSNDGEALWYPVETQLLQGNTSNRHLRLFQTLRLLESGPGQRMLVSKYPSGLVSTDTDVDSELIVDSSEDMKRWLIQILAERQKVFRVNLARYGERAIHSVPSLKRFVNADFRHPIDLESRKNRVRNLIQLLREYPRFQVGLMEDIEPEVEIAIKSTREAIMRGTTQELTNHPHTAVCGPSYMYWNNEEAVLRFYLEFEQLWAKLYEANLTDKKRVIAQLKEIVES